MRLFKSPFELLVEKATSENLVAGSEDLETTLEICDIIQSKRIPSHEAVEIILKRVHSKNPNVQLLAFQLLDACAKNGGPSFLEAMSTTAFTQDLYEIAKSNNNPVVSEKVLSCIQAWGVAFSTNSNLRRMTHLYNNLKADGTEFPPISSFSSAFFATSVAPEWKDSSNCRRCKVGFTATTRKHHCRHCGETFCQGCSSHKRPLPKFGINEAVRVCQACNQLLSSEGSNLEQKSKSIKEGTTEGELAADADLKKAIELSLMEPNQPFDREYIYVDSNISRVDHDTEAHTVEALDSNELFNEVFPSDDQKKRMLRFLTNMKAILASGNVVGTESPALHEEYAYLYPFQAKLHQSLINARNNVKVLADMEQILFSSIKLYEKKVLGRDSTGFEGTDISRNILQPNITSTSNPNSTPQRIDQSNCPSLTQLPDQTTFPISHAGKLRYDTPQMSSYYHTTVASVDSSGINPQEQSAGQSQEEKPLIEF